MNINFTVGAVLCFDARRGPDQIAQGFWGVDLQSADLLERDPGVLILHNGLEHRTDKIVIVSEVREARSIERVLEGRALFLCTVKDCSCFANTSFPQTVDCIEMQMDIGGRFADEMRPESI